MIGFALEEEDLVSVKTLNLMGDRGEKFIDIQLERFPRSSTIVLPPGYSSKLIDTLSLRALTGPGERTSTLSTILNYS